MPIEDLQQYADSNIDFYELLGIEATAGTSEIRKAWRRTSLKYHPDKNPDPAAVEKFHLLQIAVDVLCDDEVRQLYDNKRAAKEARKRQHELFEGKRRQMKEDLERREGTGKRKRDEEDDRQQQLEMEIRRLAEDGKRRRKEREEQLKRERLEEEVAQDAANDQQQQQGGEHATVKPTTQDASNGIAELDRSVKLRFLRKGKGEQVDEQHLSSLFASFGEVEAVFLLKDKKKRVDGVKRTVATGVVVFKSIVGAHAAVIDATKLKEEESWIDEIFWANEKGPQIDPKQPSSMPTDNVPHEKPSFGKTAFGKGTFSNGEGVASKPPATSTFGASLEEITMMRLKNAEKKRLEKQIREAEAAEDAAG